MIFMINFINIIKRLLLTFLIVTLITTKAIEQETLSVNIYETVRSAFRNNDRLCLENIQVDLTLQIEASKVSVDELLSALNNPNVSLARNIGAESYVPKYVLDKKMCTAPR